MGWVRFRGLGFRLRHWVWGYLGAGFGGLGVWGLRVFRGLGLKVQTISIIGKPVGVLDSVRLHVVIMESKPQYVSYF